MNDPTSMMTQARNARDQAKALLGVLLDAQRGHASSSPKDLYKRVTGSSSIEKSIATTRKLIETYDRVLGEHESVDSPATARLSPIGSLNLTATYAARSA